MPEPDTFALAVPVLLPQVALVAEAVTPNEPLAVTLTEAVALQPVLPVTVTVYVPPAMLLIVAVVALLLQTYVNGLSPVVAVTLAEPELLLHDEAVNDADRVTPVPVDNTVTDALAEHPAAPVTVTL